MNVNEIFYSLQGEGTEIGRPSVFVRLNGCNLNCSFCDTKYSLGKEGKKYTTDKIVEEIVKYPTNHVVFTGGEPMLQQKEIYKVMVQLEKFSVMVQLEKFSFEVETNGTIPPSDDFLEFEDLQFNVSLKGTSSLIDVKRRIIPGSIRRYRQFPNVKWKFVMSPNIDEIFILFTVKEFGIPLEDVIVMPLGQTREQVRLRYLKVVEFCLRNGFRFSPRVQIDLWGRKRGV